MKQGKIQQNRQEQVFDGCLREASWMQKNKADNESDKEFILAMQSLENNPERHLLNQQQVDEMVEKFLIIMHANRDHPEDDFDEKEYDLDWWVLFHADYNKQGVEVYNLFRNLLQTEDYNYDLENISFAEKCLKSVVGLSTQFSYESMIMVDWIVDSKYKEAEHDNSNLKDELSIDIVKPDIRESLILDLAILARKKIGVAANQILVDRLVEFIYGSSNNSDKFYDDNYEYEIEKYEETPTEAGVPGFMIINKLKEYLNFNDWKNFSRASATLSLLDDVARAKRGGRSTNKNDDDNIKNILEDCLRRRSGSYLLNLRAKKLKESICSGGFEFTEQAGVPFLVGHEIYAVRFESGVYLSKRENFSEISKLIKNYYRSNNDEILEKDDIYDDFEVLKEIWTFFKKKISIDDITLSVDQGNDENNVIQQLDDFSYLMEDGMKEIIKDELGVSLLDLNLQEQFYFLQYAKNVDIRKAEELKVFVKKYGKNGLKSFLSLEQDLDMGERIIHLGEQLQNNQTLADKVFAEYASNVDSAEKQAEELVVMCNEMFFNKKIDRNKVKSAILKKAKDLLFWANEGLFSCEEQEKEAMIEDLISYLARERKVENATLLRLKKIALEMNSVYKETVLAAHVLDTSKEEQGEVDREMQEFFDKGIYEAYPREEAEKMISTINKEKAMLAKFDYDRLIKEIELLESLTTMSDETFEYIVSSSGREKAEKIKATMASDREKAQPMIDKLKKLADYQKEFEKLLDRLIYGYDLNEYDNNVSGAVMKKCNEIIAQANKSKSEIKGLLEHSDLTNEEIDEISKSLVEKAGSLLDDYIERMKKEDVDENEILEELKNYQSDLLLAVSIYKTLAQGGEATPESIKGVEYEAIGSDEFFEDKNIVDRLEVEFMNDYENNTLPKLPKLENASQKDLSRAEEFWEMLCIYKKNWEVHPVRGKSFIHGFIQKLKNEKAGTNIFQYKHNGRPAAFLRIDDTEDGNKYFGSFNALSTMKGNAFGTALLKKVLAGIDNEKTVSAVVVPQERVLSTYVNKFCFVMNGIDLDCNQTGKAMVKILKPAEPPKRPYYYGDYKDEKDIVKEYEMNPGRQNHPPYFVACFDLAKEDEMNAEIKKITDEGYFSAKIVFDSENNKAYYCFEVSKDES